MRKIGPYDLGETALRSDRRRFKFASALGVTSVLLLGACSPAGTAGPEPTMFNDVWIFTYDAHGGGDAAFHQGIGHIADGCLYVGDAVVVWSKDRLDEAQNLVEQVQAGDETVVGVGGGGISLDEDDTPIPSEIVERCPTREVWFQSG